MRANPCRTRTNTGAVRRVCLSCVVFAVAGCSDAPSTGATEDATSASSTSTGTDTSGDASTSGDAPTIGGSTDTGDSTGGLVDGCFDRGCHIECFDDRQCIDIDFLGWMCDAAEICPPIEAGEDKTAAAFIESAHCLMQALRDGTPGAIRFENRYLTDLGDIGPWGYIYILADRQVAIHMADLDYHAVGSCNYMQRTRPMDLASAASTSFTDCLASDDVAMLHLCTGIGKVGGDADAHGPPSTVASFPWLTGTCAGSDAICP